MFVKGSTVKSRNVKIYTCFTNENFPFLDRFEVYISLISTLGLSQIVYKNSVWTWVHWQPMYIVAWGLLQAVEYSRDDGTHMAAQGSR